MYYLEGDVRCTIIHTKMTGDLKQVSSSYNLKTFEEELNHPDFYRVCKSYIVNLKEIAIISSRNKSVIIKNGKNIDIPKERIYKLKQKMQ
ncbi:LytTR family transcriptional regulator DNA-binding domain-containing protein [Marinilabilia sp.]